MVYLTNFTASWPYISLSSPKFLASCVLVIADHFTWFFHFAAKAQEAKRYRGARYRYGSSGRNDEGPAFMDVAAFFAICVWAVPLFLFLSLSANDNALPSFGGESETLMQTYAILWAVADITQTRPPRPPPQVSTLTCPHLAAPHLGVIVKCECDHLLRSSNRSSCPSSLFYLVLGHLAERMKRV